MGGGSSHFDPFAPLPSQQQAPPDQTATAQPQSAENDLFANFSSFDPFGNNKQEAPPPQVIIEPEPDMFDPFQPSRPQMKAQPNQGTETNKTSNRAASSSATSDPFADLANFGATAQQKTSTQSFGKNPSPSSSRNSATSQPWQGKPNYSVNFNNQQNWKASKDNNFCI